MIQLYNNLTRKKETFIPLVPHSVGLYTCGPTVYDFQHIGNLRAYIVWDVLKRFLTSQGYAVTHIMNVTDVGHLTSDSDEGEDKIEIARQREKLSAKEIAEKYFAEFKNDALALCIIPPTKYVPATSLIPEQIAFVQELESRGYLYRISDGMYFDTSKSPQYGSLGRLDIKNLIRGKRVEFNPEKRNASDFAVWKFSPKDSQREMEWESPWGVGFPGWHLECSVIARQYLGDQFDIHTGGIDHLTVHHPNEIAQSQAVTGKVPARFWLHNNFVTHKDKKISKSAGTFIRLADIVCGGVSPLSYRFYVLQTHYRKELIYSWEALQAAHQGLQNLYSEISFYDSASVGCAEFETQFTECLSDGLNTARALDVMQKLIGSKHPSGAKLRSLFMMDAVLGLGIEDVWTRRQKLSPEARAVLTKRARAREEKDWAKADLLRDRLNGMGVGVKDTLDGQWAALLK
ncbi:MAG: cysteine--tRNA ligase [Candidatus Komeilibacteria bacterium RIFCSPLOWO2_01_FULL_53_11]|uniref:Cysteine--tRNA ligase n=1 Tax=Candidatus Komeilibacteria bacterium RIFCSPLOWO2_01_FULL_53_11 TaxID=1798552 RepID=A0A1G2BUT1_9BACT|nr:MAG: cysteine--tRNA ligase [Candidatus Komeilibacteria bacterium RIFCSPLOWO2_01_FULL_53_11]